MKKFITLFLASALCLMAQAATNANVGQTVTLTAFAGPPNPTPPLSYAWFKNGSAIGSAQTGSQLTLPNIQLADAGNYSVTISNAYGSATAPAVNIAVTQVIPVASATITITVK